MRGAAGIDLGTMIKHLRRTSSGATGNGPGATMKCLRRTTSAAANNGLSTTITPPCSAASFEVNSEPHTGARPSVRLCVGPVLARCVHTMKMNSVRFFLIGVDLSAWTAVFAPSLLSNPLRIFNFSSPSQDKATTTS